MMANSQRDSTRGRMPPPPKMISPPPPPRRRSSPPPPRKRSPPPPPSRHPDSDSISIHSQPRLALVSPFRTEENHPHHHHRPSPTRRSGPPPPPPPRGRLSDRRTPKMPVPVTPLRSPQYDTRPPTPSPSPARGRKRKGDFSAAAVHLQANNKGRHCRNVDDVYSVEMKNKIGQGTFGSVFVATHKATNQKWALKRIDSRPEEEGISITALREVKLLKKLHHQNVVFLKEVVSSCSTTDGSPQNFFLVLEYFEYDLAGILRSPQIQFTLDHAKSWAHQLLQGVQYLHSHRVIHRDLKSANLLISRRTGQLKIADFGLAIPLPNRDSEYKRLTNMVVSLWYRAPELLLACYQYNSKVDLWSVGCILAELFRRQTLFPGVQESDQLQLVTRACLGHNDPQKEWPNINKECRRSIPKITGAYPSLRELLRQRLPHPQWMNGNAIHLVTHLLQVNPTNRWSAQEALRSNFFQDVKAPEELNMNFPVQTAHEMECRLKKKTNNTSNKSRQQQQPPTHQRAAPSSVETKYVNRLMSSLKKRK